MSVRLYVKLPKAPLEKEGVEKMFSDFQESFTTKLIRERKKRECRGFGFVTVPTDEAADAFISKYNDQPLIYDGETFKDEDGKEFILTIEKALPRTKNSQEDESTGESNRESPVKVNESPNTEAKPSKTPRPKKSSKNRQGIKSKATKAVSVAESIQPDPRWADQLNELKQKFAAQANN